MAVAMFEKSPLENFCWFKKKKKKRYFNPYTKWKREVLIMILLNKKYFPENTINVDSSSWSKSVPHVEGLKIIDNKVGRTSDEIVANWILSRSYREYLLKESCAIKRRVLKHGEGCTARRRRSTYVRRRDYPFAAN